MSREFCPSFKKNIAPIAHDAHLRFRKPSEENKEQCRLGIKPWLQEKGNGYPEISISKNKVWDTVSLIIECPHIEAWWWCPSWWWCRQLEYEDTQVTSIVSR
jgi:hypothetical protein